MRSSSLRCSLDGLVCVFAVEAQYVAESDLVRDIPEPTITDEYAISPMTTELQRNRQVLDKRKSEAVRRAFEEEVTPLTPESILQKHLAVTAYLDLEAASLCIGHVTHRRPTSRESQLES